MLDRDRELRRGALVRVLARTVLAGSLAAFLAAGTCHSSFCSGSECHDQNPPEPQPTARAGLASTYQRSVLGWHPALHPLATALDLEGLRAGATRQ